MILSVIARPLIWLPEELWDSKFSSWKGLKACPHCTTDLDLTSQIASAQHHRSESNRFHRSHLGPVWANYARACTLLRDIYKGTGKKIFILIFNFKSYSDEVKVNRKLMHEIMVMNNE